MITTGTELHACIEIENHAIPFSYGLVNIATAAMLSGIIVVILQLIGRPKYAALFYI